MVRHSRIDRPLQWGIIAPPFSTMLLQTHHVTVLPSLSWLAKVKPYAGSSNGRVIIGQAENGGLKEPLFRSFQATVDTIKGLWSTPAETTRNRAEYQPTFRPDCS